MFTPSLKIFTWVYFAQENMKGEWLLSIKSRKVLFPTHLGLSCLSVLCLNLDDSEILSNTDAQNHGLSDIRHRAHKYPFHKASHPWGLLALPGIINFKLTLNSCTWATMWKMWRKCIIWMFPVKTKQFPMRQAYAPASEAYIYGCH